MVQLHCPGAGLLTCTGQPPSQLPCVEPVHCSAHARMCRCLADADLHQPCLDQLEPDAQVSSSPDLPDPMPSALRHSYASHIKDPRCSAVHAALALCSQVQASRAHQRR